MNISTLRYGFKFPIIGLGTWKIPKDLTTNVVLESIRCGIRHIDCACDYGNEKQVGEGIKLAISEGLCVRSDLFITSKLWNTYHSKLHVKLACEKSLSDLSLDYLDAYLIHFPISQRFVPFQTRYPPEWIYDPLSDNPVIEMSKVPIAETWGAMEDLVRIGLVRSIGVCNFMVQSLMDLLSYAEILPSICQVEVHPYLSQPGLVDFCARNGIQVTAFSPLGAPSYKSLGMDRGLDGGALVDPVVTEIAAVVGRTPAQVILRWSVQRGIAVIPKSNHIDRIRENAALFDFELTSDQMSAMSSLDKNIRFNDPGEFCKGMGGSIPIFA